MSMSSVKWINMMHNSRLKFASSIYPSRSIVDGSTLLSNNQHGWQFHLSQIHWGKLQRALPPHYLKNEWCGPELVNFFFHVLPFSITALPLSSSKTPSHGLRGFIQYLEYELPTNEIQVNPVDFQSRFPFGENRMSKTKFQSEWSSFQCE